MKFYVLIFNLFLSCAVFSATKKGVIVKVDLSPAGGFTITGKIKGKVILKKGVYEAKTISTRVSGFKTGLDLRDQHTKEKLLFKKFPKIIVKNAKGKNGKGEGVILIKEIEKRFKFTFKEVGKYIKAKFSLKINDFKFPKLKYLGVGVKNVVKIEATIPLKKQ